MLSEYSGWLLKQRSDLGARQHKKFWLGTSPQWLLKVRIIIYNNKSLPPKAMLRLKKVFFFKSLTIWKTQAWIALQPQIENVSWHIHAINLSTKLCFIPLTSAPRAQLCGPRGVHIIPGTASGGPHKSPLRWGAKARFIVLRLFLEFYTVALQCLSVTRQTLTGPLHLHRQTTLHILSPTLALGSAWGCPCSQPRLCSGSQISLAGENLLRLRNTIIWLQFNWFHSIRKIEFAKINHLFFQYEK